MTADLQTYVAFHRTGRRSADVAPVDAPPLWPALLARFRDLGAIRHDFPVVLVQQTEGERTVRPLPEILDAALRDLAQGADGDRIAAHVGRLERQIRALAAEQGGAQLSALWNVAATRLGAQSHDLLRNSLDRARSALAIDGQVVGCDENLAALVMEHLWRAAQQAKARRFQSAVSDLVRRLSELLRGDDARSESGRTPARLQAAVGAGFEDAFDFSAMSQVVSRSAPKATLTDARRRRIQSLVDALHAQPFFSPAFSFEFDSVVAARDAYRERLPDLVAVARAMAMAELEVAGEYREARHDSYFQDLSAADLAPQDLALFPDYLITLPPGPVTPIEQATLLEVLSAAMPVRVLVQTDDLVDNGIGTDGHVSLDFRVRQIAGMAMALSDVFVLQAPASHLPRMCASLERGMAYPGPLVVCVYSGDSGRPGQLAPYLMAAAALEARVFPAFVYDPAAGSDWASRFDLSANPQPDLDWPAYPFAYEDETRQSKRVDVAFTPVDLLACDSRCARHLMRTDRTAWTAGMIPVSDALAAGAKSRRDHVPFLWMVDGGNALHRVVADDTLLRESHRCRDMWHSLQELGGIHNSFAERALARERARRDADAPEAAIATMGAAAIPPAAVQGQPASPGTTMPPPAAEPAVAGSVVAGAQPVEAVNPDEPYIETPRCSTCNECTQINNRMFAYNENRQAYIANPDAGSYRELVEAAESCQVSIIHPGKPRNPHEPGLEELIERARPFV